MTEARPHSALPSYLFRVNREFLEIDLVELDPVLRELLKHLPQGSSITWHLTTSGRTRTGKTADAGKAISASLRVDWDQGVLTGRGVGKKLAALMEPSGAPLLLITPETTSAHYRIDRPLAPRPQSTPETAPMEDAAIHFHHDAGLALARRLATLPEESLTREQLHSQGLSLSLRRGFDTLISLAAVRGFEPFPHQIRAAERTLRELRGRALLCDEVGLGKTIEAGIIVNEYVARGLVRRALVLTPAPLVTQWQEELMRKFDLPFVSQDSAEFQLSDRPWAAFAFTVASLETAKREPHRDQILAIDYDLVIVDEAHRLKNRQTVAWKFVSQLKKKYLLLLTATPIENSMDELFNLITLLKPGQLKTPGEYRQRFVDAKNPLQPKNMAELKRLIQAVMIRNRRSTTGIIQSARTAETLWVVPEAVDDQFYQLLTGIIKRALTQESPQQTRAMVLKTLLRQAGSHRSATKATLLRLKDTLADSVSRSEWNGLLHYVDDSTTSAKMNALARILADGREQTVVFSGFLETQKAVADYIRSLGLDVAEFHGSMSRGDKEQAISKFRWGVPVLVSSDSGGEGRNLQFCHRLVNYDIPWNPMRIEQRIGRIHRIGQVHDVLVANLVSRGTIEEHVVRILDEKINLFQLVVGELDMILGAWNDDRNFETTVWDIWRSAETRQHLDHEMERFGDNLFSARQQYQHVKDLDNTLFEEWVTDV